MSGSITYRGIQIVASDLPSGHYTWVHDEGDTRGTAETVEEARAQIDRHLSELADSRS